MFFILSKLFLFMTTPFFWWLVLLILALSISSKIWKRRLIIFASIYLLFFTNTFIFLEFERLWEVKGTRIDKIEKTYDIGVVLSGMGNYNQDLKRIQINQNGDRIWHTITLYKKGIIKKILISGKDGSIYDYGLNEAIQFRDNLLEWGIPSNDIMIEDSSRNTYENALYTKQLLNNHPEIKSVLLITSANHMRRASACFRKQNTHFDTFTTNVYNGENRIFNLDHLFIPDFNNFSYWNNLTKEWVGYLIYKMTGKL